MDAQRTDFFQQAHETFDLGRTLRNGGSLVNTFKVAVSSVRSSAFMEVPGTTMSEGAIGDI